MAGKHRKDDRHPTVKAAAKVAGHHVTHIVTLVSLHAAAITMINHGGPIIGIVH